MRLPIDCFSRNVLSDRRHASRRSAAPPAGGPSQILDPNGDKVGVPGLAAVAVIYARTNGSFYIRSPASR